MRRPGRAKMATLGRSSWASWPGSLPSREAGEIKMGRKQKEPCKDGQVVAEKSEMEQKETKGTKGWASRRLRNGQTKMATLVRSSWPSWPGRMSSREVEGIKMGRKQKAPCKDGQVMAGKSGMEQKETKGTKRCASRRLRNGQTKMATLAGESWAMFMERPHRAPPRGSERSRRSRGATGASLGLCRQAPPASETFLWERWSDRTTQADGIWNMPAILTGKDGHARAGKLGALAAEAPGLGSMPLQKRAAIWPMAKRVCSETKDPNSHLSRYLNVETL